MHFLLAEYEDRLAKTRIAMRERGLSLLVVTDPSNMAWLTGYDGWSFYVHQCVLIDLHNQPIWWGRGIDAPGALRTVYMDQANVVSYEDHYVQNPTLHPMQTLAALIQERALDISAMGVEMDNYYYTAAAHQSLVSSLGISSWSDATALVNWQRAIKSETELHYMRKAARIVEHMHQTILEKAEPGLRKHELVADIYKAAIEGVDDCWGDYPAIVPLTPSGMDATAAHLTWNDDRMVTGESTFFEIAGVHKRYHCPQSRTVFLGEPPDKYRRAEQAVLEAMESAIALAKPGNHCEDIANAFNHTLNQHGFTKDNRCGYAIGLSYPPDWGERTMSLRRGDMSVLQPGMTFHFMPALWLDDGGLELTEPLLITDTGHECLCNTPRELFVKH